jgi:EmrB/QacA subfamily drug resistance transporter
MMTVGFGRSAVSEMNAHEKEAPSVRRAGLIAASLSTFLTAFLLSALNIAVPALQKEFRMDAILLSWVALAGILTSAILVVPLGRLADIYGRRRVFTYGLVTFTGSSLLCGFSVSAGTLIASTVIQSIGAAMIFSTSMAIITAIYPASQRGRVLGIAVAAVYVGLSSGPLLGGFLTGYIGWRSIFFAIVPVGLSILLVVRFKLKQEWREASGERFDFIGSLVYSISLFFVIFGFSRLPSNLGFLFLGGGILAGAAFFSWEGRVAAPILHLSLLRGNRVFALSNLAALVHYSATSAVIFLMSLYLQYVRGMTPQHAGFVLVCQPIVQAAITPFAGRLSDRVEPRIVSSIGMGITGLSLLSLAMLTSATPLPVILGNLSLLGLGFALFSSPNTNAIMSSIDKRFYGVGSGIQATSRMVGQAFSMGFTMLVFALLLGRAEMSPAIYPLFLKSAKMLFLFFAVLCCGSIAASLARGNIRTSLEKARP